MSYIAKVIVLVLTLNTLADAEELILSGVYVVPTSEKNLTQAAQFKVTNYKIIDARRRRRRRAAGPPDPRGAAAGARSALAHLLA